MQASDRLEVGIRIINSAYGLKVESADTSKIIDKEKGNSITMQVTYQSKLQNPNIRVALYRRNYAETYAQEYELVDLKEYVTDTLEPGTNAKEYIFAKTPSTTQLQILNLKTNLITGTYKICYKLYDGNNYVGEDYEYIIIK